MMINRRDFLILTAGFVSACASTVKGNGAPASGVSVVNAGPLIDYSKDGVYPGFRSRGFFIIRQNGNLFVLSSTCTHRKCRLQAKSDHSFYCPCHGSTFAPGGHVTRGPARHDLPIFNTTVDDHGNLLVTVPR